MYLLNISHTTANTVVHLPLSLIRQHGINFFLISLAPKEIIWKLPLFCRIKEKKCSDIECCRVKRLNISTAAINLIRFFLPFISLTLSARCSLSKINWFFIVIIEISVVIIARYKLIFPNLFLKLFIYYLFIHLRIILGIFFNSDSIHFQLIFSVLTGRGTTYFQMVVIILVIFNSIYINLFYSNFKSFN